MGNLADKTIKGTLETGKSYNDGDGLRLKVSKAGTKSWLFRYRFNGKSREMGLGTYPTRSLAAARAEVTRLRLQVLDGTDPLAEKSKKRKEAAKSAEWIFSKCTDEFHKQKSVNWSPRHAKCWIQAMEKHVYPVMGSLSIADVETAHVLEVLDPLWNDHTVLASTLRERMQRVISWAAVRGHREKGLNPAAWTDNLEHIYDEKKKVRKTKHRPALPYQEIGAFMQKLKEIDTPASRALQLTILTACRTNEVLGATWDEIDGDVWTIPEERMKMDAEHRVPLTPQALALIGDPTKGFVFSSIRYGWSRKMARVQMIRLLRTMRSDITVHGFRSTFRDWAEEQTSYPWEIKELSLAHKVGSNTEKAYKRTDSLEKRRALMQAWADYCDRVQTTADVVGIRSAK